MTRREALALAWSCHRQQRRARIEDYTELRSHGLTRTQAAERMGVSYRTIMRYERTLRAAP